MGLNGKPPAMARLALVAEESWENPISEIVSAATLALQPVGTETFSRPGKGRTPIEWAPECSFGVTIVHLRSSLPHSNQSIDHEADFTG
jgi:hypothetical protein